MSSAGKWKLIIGKVATQFGASFLTKAKEILHGIHHKELHDLQYVVERAIKECRDELPEPFKHEID